MLKLGDKNEQVKQLQRALGLPQTGVFDITLEAKVKEFQRKHGLTVDGKVGPLTWAKLLEPKSTIVIPNGVLEGFKGDLEWIHKWESHVGKPYWPGGASGITLDPGFDLGYATPNMLVDYYKDILSQEQIKRLMNVLGLKGDKAKNALTNNPMNDIHITKEQAMNVFPWVADPFWKTLTKRWPNLILGPSTVHTAILSLGYNRGASNSKLSVLDKYFGTKDWIGLAKTIATMQQDHPLEGIRKRRQAEAKLILESLKV